MRIHYIYKITNKINGKIYIGQSVNPKARWQKHISNSKKYHKNRTYYLQRSLGKYGKDNFLFEIIDQCNSFEESNSKEIYWIAYYDSTNPEIGMNLTKGGLSHPISDEIKKRLSNYNKGNVTVFGEMHPFSKLKDSDVILIRKLYSEGADAKDLAEKFGIKKQVVHKIINYITWKHIPGPIKGKDYVRVRGKVYSEEETINKLKEKAKVNNFLKKSKKRKIRITNRLKEDDVILLRKLYSEGTKSKDLAEKFGICRSSVQKIVNYSFYKHIP